MSKKTFTSPCESATPHLMYQEKTKAVLSTEQRSRMSDLLFSNEAAMISLDAINKMHNDTMEILLATVKDKEDLRAIKRAYRAQLKNQKRIKEKMYLEHRAKVNSLIFIQQALSNTLEEIHREYNEELETLASETKA